MWRKFSVLAALAALLAVVGIGVWAQTAVAASPFPDVIPLPDGYRPEGIATGRGPVIYAGSLANGSIYKADLRTGAGEILVGPQAGLMAVGLAFDTRSNYLFASGGQTGKAAVYDAGTGESLAVYPLVAADSSPFINDAIVTHEAVYFTNSFAPEYYRVPLGSDGTLPPASAVETIALGGDYVHVGGFNVNGIVATSDGHLIMVNTGGQTLYRVEPLTGEAVAIDLGGASVAFGDGLVLDENTLYVVQNQLNQVAVIELNDTFTAGTLVETITNEAFRIPTTAALFGSRLYVVNARFDTPPTPDTEYEIVQVSVSR